MSIERLAFDHIVEKLSSQRQYLQNLRNQASVAAAVTGLIATVFATISAAKPNADIFAGDAFLSFSLPALLLFVILSGSIVCSILVVISFREFTFSFDTTKMLEKRKEYGSDQVFYSSYASDGEFFFRENEEYISGAQRLLWFAFTLGFCQIFPWLAII